MYTSSAKKRFREKGLALKVAIGSSISSYSFQIEKICFSLETRILFSRIDYFLI